MNKYAKLVMVVENKSGREELDVVNGNGFTLNLQYDMAQWAKADAATLKAKDLINNEDERVRNHKGGSNFHFTMVKLESLLRFYGFDWVKLYQNDTVTSSKSNKVGQNDTLPEESVQYCVKMTQLKPEDQALCVKMSTAEKTLWIQENLKVVGFVSESTVPENEPFDPKKDTPFGSFKDYLNLIGANGTRQRRSQGSVERFSTDFTKSIEAALK